MSSLSFYMGWNTDILFLLLRRHLASNTKEGQAADTATGTGGFLSGSNFTVVRVRGGFQCSLEMFFVLLLWFLSPVFSVLLTIGAGKDYLTLEAACLTLQCRGSLEFVVDPGTYNLPQFAVTTPSSLTIRRFLSPTSQVYARRNREADFSICHLDNQHTCKLNLGGRGR